MLPREGISCRNCRWLPFTVVGLRSRRLLSDFWTPSGFREGKALLSTSPSTAAISREYAKLQKNSKTAIHDGFYACKQPPHPTVVTIAPPVQIFHPVFQEFLDRVDSPTFQPDEEVLSIVSKLMPTVTEIHPSEYNAFANLRPLFTKLLGGYVGPVISTGTRILDSVRFKQLGEYLVPLVCIEYERAFGEGGCDPLDQASYSIREFLVSPEVRGFCVYFLHLS